jgi:hypothetical protein
MGAPTSEVSYTSATTGRGDHEVHKGHVVAKKLVVIVLTIFFHFMSLKEKRFLFFVYLAYANVHCAYISSV